MISFLLICDAFVESFFQRMHRPFYTDIEVLYYSKACTVYSTKAREYVAIDVIWN